MQNQSDSENFGQGGIGVLIDNSTTVSFPDIISVLIGLEVITGDYWG